MINELYIDRKANGVDIALLCDKLLTEFHQDKENSSFRVGDVYFGRVRKTMPSLNAAFIDVGYEKDGFLHYFDLGPHFKSLQKVVKIAFEGGFKSPFLDGFQLEPEIIKTGKISEVLKKNDLVLVQVDKEPISNKGPKLTTDISIAGRYCVLVPFSNSLSISKKIGNPKEKRRLKTLATDLKPDNFGLIIRTVAEGTSSELIQKDIEDLKNKWSNMIFKLKGASSKARIIGEHSKVETLLRDLLNDNFSNIYVNETSFANEIKEYVERISPGSEKIVKEYKGKTPIFQHFGIDKQIKASFGKQVSFSAGAYLVIEHTEALHVIDVNSGRLGNDSANQQETALKVNMEASKEIARQLRLRDMGGIIVVDFIDLKNPAYRKELSQVIKEAMKTDRARHQVLPMSQFGLVQITRQRVRPEMNIITAEVCPACNGSGNIESSIILTDRIHEHLQYIIEHLNPTSVSIRVNPLIAASLRSGFPSIRMKWSMANKKWIRVIEDTGYSLNKFSFENNSGDEFVI